METYIEKGDVVLSRVFLFKGQQVSLFEVEFSKQHPRQLKEEKRNKGLDEGF